jgi:hypothetical protein
MKHVERKGRTISYMLESPVLRIDQIWIGDASRLNNTRDVIT